jgi:choline dehydrogenase-like flavoprotein
VRALFRNQALEQDEFTSEDEQTMRIMCIAAMGRDKSVGRFRLGRGRDTRLRVDREDGLKFHEDPIYAQINASLDAFAERLTGGRDRHFLNPFLTDSADALGSRAINLSHPLGGCGAAADAEQGVTDELGHVFDTSKSSERPFHEGLFIADGARIPTALGVYPSLTITALALRTADTIIAELP